MEREASKGCNCPKCGIIYEIWASKKPVQKRIVFETLDESEAFAYEHDLIKQYAGPGLVNMSGNRDEYKPSPQRRRNPQPISPIKVRRIKAELQEQVIGVAAAAYLFGVDSKTVIRLIQRGAIPGFQVGDVWKVYQKDVENYIQQQSKRAVDYS